MQFRLISVLTLMVVVAAACGTDSAPSSGQVTQAPTSGPSELPGRELTVFEQLLSLVPDTPETRAVTRMNDVNATIDIHGLELPGPNATIEEVLEFKFLYFLGTHDREDRESFTRISILGDDYLAGFNLNYFPEEGVPNTKETLGFDVRDIDAWAVAAGTDQFGVSGLEIVTGSFDPAVAADLIGSCADCPESELVTYQETSYFSFPAQQNIRELKFRPPLFDHLGRGGNLLIQDSRAYRALSSREIEQAIDTAEGSHPNLGDDESYAEVARRLADAEAVSAFFTDQTFTLEAFVAANGGVEVIERSGLGEGVVDRARDVITATSAIPIAEVTGVGFSADENGRFILVALAFLDEEIASNAASALGERLQSGLYPLPRSRNGELIRWTEIFDHEVMVSERFVEIELHPTDPSSGLGFTVANSGFIADLIFGNTLGFLLATDQ